MYYTLLLNNVLIVFKDKRLHLKTKHAEYVLPVFTLILGIFDTKHIMYTLSTSSMPFYFLS